MKRNNERSVTLEVTCPVCGKTWEKTVAVTPWTTEAGLRMSQRPTCCSKECRQEHWRRVYGKAEE